MRETRHFSNHRAGKMPHLLLARIAYVFFQPPDDLSGPGEGSDDDKETFYVTIEQKGRER
jgi:hypothetical protein